MSITETATTTTTITRSECGKHRYLLSREWDAEKKQALLIMLCAGSADTVTVDTTTMLVLKNLRQLDFGGVSICNLFSTPAKDTDEENNRIILTAAMKAETIIFAWGTGSATSPAAQKRIAEVLEMLKPYQKHTYCIAAPNGKAGMHPLAPVLRDRWELVPWAGAVDASHEEKAKTPSQRGKKKAVPPTTEAQSFNLADGEGAA